MPETIVTLSMLATGVVIGFCLALMWMEGTG